MLRAFGEVVRSPVVVDQLPVLLGHHAVDRLDCGDGHASRLGLEGRVGNIVVLGLAPVIRTTGHHAAAGGGTGLVEARGIELGDHGVESAVDFRRRIAFVARAPQGDGGMVAVAEDLVADVGEVDREVVGVGAVAGVGLEEFVPDEDAVLVAELVEVLTGGLADPVADHVHVGEGVQVNLGVEPGAGDALEGFVEAPVAAADEDLDAVDGDGEGVHAAVGDFANAEGGVVRIGVAAVFDEVEVEGVEVLRTVAVGPPEFWIGDVKGGRGFGIEAEVSSFVGLEGDLLGERDVSDGAFEGAGLWFG